jgi:hypothetical protein
MLHEYYVHGFASSSSCFFGVGEWLVDWHILVAMAADDEWASWGASASREPSQNTLDALFD